MWDGTPSRTRSTLPSTLASRCVAVHGEPTPSRLLHQVLTVDTAAKTVHTSKGNTFEYDILVLATGSAAGLPPYVTPQIAKDTKGTS